MLEPTPLFHPATDTAPPRVAVIAELGVNHDGEEARAIELVDAARDAGVDAIKLQWFVPDRLLSNQALLAAYQEGQAEDPRAMLQRLMLPVESVQRVRQRAEAVGLHFVLTLFSPADAPTVESLSPDAVKIASPDAVNMAVLRAAAALDRPLLCSTGTCAMDELGPAARLLQRHRAGGALLQCVSSYPAPNEQAALAGIGALAQRYDVPSGYSDHTTDPLTGALAVAAGALVIEKHLTHDRGAAGPDHAASFEPAQMADYVQAVRQAAAMHGGRGKRVQPVEADVARVARQSVCVKRDLDAGHVLTAEDLTVKRPGTGIPAARLPETIGRRLAQPASANDLLTEAHLETASAGAA